MEKKIICIFVFTLMISAAVIPVLGMINNKTFKEKTSNNHTKMEDSFAGCFSPGWSYKTTLNNPGPDDNESFGRSVSISGCYAIVGCHFDTNPPYAAGSAYIYERNPITEIWSPYQIITAPDPNFGYFFGYSVSIDGDTAIIGSPGHSHLGSFPAAGKAYIFQPDSTGTWIHQVTLQAFTPSIGAHFGCSVSIDGDNAVVGAFGEDAAYFFERTSGVWNSAPVATFNPGSSGDRVGWSVSINGDYAVVGGYSDTTNNAYVYEKTSGVWNPIPVMLNPLGGGAPYDRFGCSVSIDGDYAFIGAHDHNNYKGEVYVYEKTSGVWNPIPVMLNPTGVLGPDFGYSVSINGDHAVVGAPGFNTGQGTAYVFERTSTGWSQVAMLTNPLPAAVPQHCFGCAVDIDHCYAIIGAPGYSDPGVLWHYEGIAYVFENDEEVPDLIIYDNSGGPPTTLIGNNVYETAPPWIGVTQIGKWLLHIPTFYLFKIELQNDGCAPLTGHTIYAEKQSIFPLNPIALVLIYINNLGGISSMLITSAGSSVTNGITVSPSTSTVLGVMAYPVITNFKIGLYVKSSTGNQDSVILKTN